ncbi:flagellar basal-body rod modification protein FlgD [Sphingomonas naasensis]|uniref:Basal-body rod modification protein FlgD n=1 Tax=Sphingomonas naasensis TaxID=1344951 RepID=A0A4S1WPP6_9SPHN|nr:flagellar hook capping FlgD N-terminal domain-containing protein [Sphingomonas naasensis]NIJ20824.1 flagellar basal-body rod modification protein FlgD [Sphingomonas naasensis]TGX43226.1 flagellar biosynthesis protein FlgD [Sphingomonas naasensis]
MTTVNSATTVADAKTAAASTKINADFDMFLKLLTTQMQNQDPLDPMDTAQYTQQLVQYSQVEQSIEQTKTLKEMLSAFGTQNLMQASALIGAQVETNSEISGLSAATPAQWTWSATREVASMTGTITDEKGKVVDTFPIDTSGTSGAFTWDGTTSNGKKVDPGLYKLELEGKDASGTAVSATAHAFGKVTDVELDNGSVQLTINGLQVASGDLLRVG